MITRRRFLQNLSLGTSTALAIAACNTTNPSSQTPSNSASTGSTLSPVIKTPTQIKIGAVTGINSIDVWIPYDLGYFKDAGLDVEVIQFRSAPKMRDALVAGELDFSAQAPLHVYLSRLKGIPLKVVANRRNIVDAALVVRQTLQTSTRQVADLKGKSIAIGTIGSWSWALAEKYLQKNGLDPATDVQYVSSESSTNYALIKSGQVDAVVANAPDLTKILQEQAGYILVDPTDPTVHQEYFGAAEAMTRAWLAHERILTDKPDAIEQLVQAANRTFDYLHNTAPSEVATAIANHFEGTSVPLLADSIQRDIKRAIPTDSSISKAAYQADLQVFLETGVIKQAVPYEEGVYDAKAGNRA